MLAGSSMLPQTPGRRTGEIGGGLERKDLWRMKWHTSPVQRSLVCLQKCWFVFQTLHSAANVGTVRFLYARGAPPETLSVWMRPHLFNNYAVILKEMGHGTVLETFG